MTQCARFKLLAHLTPPYWSLLHCTPPLYTHCTLYTPHYSNNNLVYHGIIQHMICWTVCVPASQPEPSQLVTRSDPNHTSLLVAPTIEINVTLIGFWITCFVKHIFPIMLRRSYMTGSRDFAIGNSFSFSICKFILILDFLFQQQLTKKVRCNKISVRILVTIKVWWLTTIRRWDRIGWKRLEHL